MKKSFIYLFSLACFILTGCTNTTHSVITPEKSSGISHWSTQQLQQDISATTIYTGEHSSTHLVRLMGKEKPHFHDRHDLNVSILTGQSKIHFKDHSIELSAGDQLVIPKGTYHWAENTGEHASILVTVFSPPFDGRDKRFAE